MTRINCIPPAELTSSHLVAEYRELPRIFNAAYKAYKRGEKPESFPKTYRMGKGHVKFFYDKLEYLRLRFYDLVKEMQNRGYTTNYSEVPDSYWKIPEEYKKQWIVDENSQNINRKRISERLNGI